MVHEKKRLCHCSICPLSNVRLKFRFSKKSTKSSLLSNPYLFSVFPWESMFVCLKHYIPNSHCSKLNMNEETEQVPIQLPNIARTLSGAKKIIKKKFLSLDLGDNPIYPIWKFHGWGLICSCNVRTECMI